MAKRRRRSWLASGLIILLVFIFFLGFGFLLGFRLIIKQTARFDAYDKAMAIQAERKNKEKEEANSDQTEETTPDGQPIPAVSTKAPNADDPNAVEVVDANTPGAVQIVVKRGDKTADIARKLQEKGVIKNTTLFTLLSKINGFDSAYRSGTHFVKANMSYDEIMYLLSLNPATIDVTFPEGLTYREVKARLQKAGVRFDEKKLDALVMRPDAFANYDFVTDIPMTPERQWPLQGYLFPDTYFFDLNSDEETIIDRFLSNTNRQLLPELYQRAKAIDMTMDQVITLASIIQMESSVPSDMYKVSRVFHNRLNKNDYLQSCATVNYLRKERGEDPVLIVGEEDLKDENPYNTYTNKGLPPGPICSPGIEAIKAALYPDSDKTLYYFVAKGDGTNFFTSYADEHEKAIQEYVVPQQKKLEEERAAEEEAADQGESEGEEQPQTETGEGGGE